MKDLSDKKISDMTYPEQIHELSKRTRDLADYWNRASVERCDIFKAIQLKNYSDIGFLCDMLKKHCKISFELVDSIEDLLLRMDAFECCKRMEKQK